VMGKVVPNGTIWLAHDRIGGVEVRFVSFRDSHRGKRTKKGFAEFDRCLGRQLVTWRATWRCRLDQFGPSHIAMSFDAFGHLRRSGPAFSFRPCLLECKRRGERFCFPPGENGATPLSSSTPSRTRVVSPLIRTRRESGTDGAEEQQRRLAVLVGWIAHSSCGRVVSLEAKSRLGKRCLRTLNFCKLREAFGGTPARSEFLR
jgi:hypothetical protein